MSERKIRIPIWFIFDSGTAQYHFQSQSTICTILCKLYFSLYGWKAMEELPDVFLFQWEK